MNASTQNTINFLSKLTVRRVWNMSLVYLSFYLTKYFKKPIQYGKPFSISFEPTTSCNLRCPECPSGLRAFTRPIGMLVPAFFEKTIDELSNHLLYLTFYFQGEPYLNTKFLDMVRYAKQKNIYTATSTNAHYLTDDVAKRTIESGLDRLIISIDGTTQETYQSYRVGGHLYKVIEGAKNMVKWKKELKAKTPYIIFQFLVVKPNEHQIDDLKKIAKEIGVDEVILKTAQVYDYKNGNPLIPENEQYSRYKKNNDGTYSIKNNLENSCWKLWHSCVITWDGKVVPCCFDKDAQHQLGNLQTHSFSQIWNNDLYKNFRTQLVKGRKEIDICKNCSEGCEVNFNYEV
ncbi:MAG TPA: SPASM domain-containing protein [Chitinophagales bacterium]|nr:MAG: radical SAM protein [Bacteroidia bacterium]HMV15931.1 SPASM domain-containing protein [Chitinophagales bacterium]HMW12972.1 SPASM domain-containing protein [Chitinophagales bacterium]HMX61321.1 SPASM domain-containing protein [Chitinophagales bacterium]HMY23458.1 SPASM domain-containing protein [Chitinophagales bacterium]